MPPVAGFSTLQAEGVAGSELQCDGSVLPDRCAFPSVVEATEACQALPACRSVVIYSQGEAISPPPEAAR